MRHTVQETETAAGPLTGLRVIDLGDGTAGPFCAKLLGDFGAEVVKVESRAGDTTRFRGPFAEDRPDPESSGLFHYLNTNKYGVVLDLEGAESSATLEKLLAQSDVLVTNLPTERLRAANLSPAALRLRHPHLIITSISPFGSDGPWAAMRGDELVTYAMGGMAYGTPGMPDAADDLETEPPLHPSCYVAETMAGLIAATATMSAVENRHHTGNGCHVELSQHAAVAAMQHRDMTNFAYLDGTFNRLLNPVSIGRMPNFYLPCKDGYATIAAPMEIHWQRLVEAMGHPDWAKTAEFSTSSARSTNWIELRSRLVEWTMTVTGEELYALACESQLPIFPFYSVRKLVDCDQVAARGSVVEFMLGERLARMPAAPVQMKGTPWALRRPAPRKGEHTAHIVDQWTGPGASPRTTTSPKSNAESSEEQRLPLAGLRVLDLGQFIAIPFCTLWLAWLGAEVIVVETRKRMTSRTAPPFAPGLEGNPDASAYCNLLNSSKKSVTVDLTTEAGCDLVRRLASVVDVMVDNFSTGVLEKLDLDYATISAQNPRLIAVSCGAFGRSGPMKNARGLHSAVNLFSGVADVTGYVGGHPRILGSVLPDPLSGTYANFAIQAALHHRHRSGRGQFIDLAMYEAMLSLIPEAVIDFSINNRDPRRAGNRDPIKVPHGIYRCRQEGGWVAISVDGDADWKAMCTAAGHAEWHQDPRFANVAARQDHVVLLDQIVGAWTIGLDVDQVTQLLQAAGVAAGPVLRCDQLVDDIRLQARGTVITTDHPVVGSRRQLGLPWRMDSAATHYSRAPLLGEHSRDLLTSLLGLDGAQYDRLVADGVLS